MASRLLISAEKSAASNCLSKMHGCKKKKTKKTRSKSSGSTARQRDLNFSPKVRFVIRKHDKLNIRKIKNLCSVKDPIKRIKKQSPGGGKICEVSGNYICGAGV